MLCSCSVLLIKGLLTFDCPAAVVYGPEESEIEILIEIEVYRIKRIHTFLVTLPCELRNE